MSETAEYLEDLPAEEPGPDPRIEEAVLGRDVERFLEEDPIGKYIAERARADSEEARAALLICDPTDTTRVRELQFKGRLPELVVGWLGAAIENGRAAAQLLQQEIDEHGST